MKTLTYTALVGLLGSRLGAEPIGFSSFTDAMKRKTGCPFVSIRKWSRVHPMTGTNYENAVNRQREREGNVADFVAQSAKYEHIGGHLVRYKTTGNICLAVQFRQGSNYSQTSRAIYLARVSDVSPWVIVPHAMVSQWVDAANPYAANEGQDLNRAIIWRTYGLGGIVSLAVGGEKFRIRQPSPVLS